MNQQTILKVIMLTSTPSAFIVSALMAGAYVGFGIILIFSVGAAIPGEFQKLVMGVSFGIALTLVIFAGSELFTGHTMYMVFGWLKKVTGPKDRFGSVGGFIHSRGRRRACQSPGYPIDEGRRL